MKKILSLLLILCLVVSCLPLSTLAVTDAGENNTSAEAQSFSPGDKISGTISPEGDIDFYKFTISQSGRVTFDVTSYMEFYSLHLYDQSGNELWKNTNNQWNSTVGFRSDVLTIDLEAGTYYLKVTGEHYGYMSSSTGSYTVSTSFSSVNANEEEPNNSVAQADEIIFGQKIQGLIGVNDAYDFHEFTLSRSGRVTFDITSYMEFYSLHLYDQSGSELWKNTNNQWNSTVGFRSDVLIIDLEAGTYYLKVTGEHYGYMSSSTGTYTIGTSFTPSNANETEPNNSASQANKITFGQRVQGLIGINDRYDFYEFTLPKAQEISINITSYMQYYSLYIYDEAGKELWKDDYNEWNSTLGSRADALTVALDAGSYYLKVTGYLYGASVASTGTYTFTVRDAGAQVKPVTGVKLNQTSLKLVEGDSATLKATVSPSDAEDPSVIWSSSNNSIATVDQNGVVNAISEGKATVTVTTLDGGYTASCSVTVEADPTTATGMPFRDVTPDSWYTEAIKYVYVSGLMAGTGSTQFSPNGTTTRGQLVTILYRLEGEPTVSGTSSFTDVKTGAWYTNAVEWAVKNGIVNGYGNGKFGPNDAITREQMATILWRYAKHKSYDTSKTAGLNTFSDASKVGSYASTAMKWAVAVGLINGKDGNKLDPKGIARRSETATILMRFCENIAK